eukprot:11449155-Alexandrium_andersonii.AAC.1
MSWTSRPSCAHTPRLCTAWTARDRSQASRSGAAGNGPKADRVAARTRPGLRCQQEPQSRRSCTAVLR